MGAGIPATTLSGLVRSFAALSGATFQPNVVDVAMLRDAGTHPERRRDLTVRICALTACFATADARGAGRDHRAPRCGGVVDL